MDEALRREPDQVTVNTLMCSGSDQWNDMENATLASQRESLERKFSRNTTEVRNLRYNLSAFYYKLEKLRAHVVVINYS
jgi:hypothetical protein